MKTYKLSHANFDYVRDVLHENCAEDIEQRLLESSVLIYKYVEITNEKFAKQLIMYINGALQGCCLKEEWKARHIAWMEMLTKIKKELLK